jgi:PAS domain S-box-containing protein
LQGAHTQARDKAHAIAEESRAAALTHPRSPVGPRLAGRAPVLRYAVALLIVAIVAAARLAIVPMLGVHAPLLPFAVAIFAVAYLCGFWPALLATVASAAAATLYVAVYSSFDSVLSWAGHVAVFVMLGALVALMMHRLQQAYRSQREALDAAHASAAQLQLIADSLPVLLAYVDSEERYRFNNRAYEQWFELRPAELYGRHMRDVLGESAYATVKPHVTVALAGETSRFDAEVSYREGGPKYISAYYVPDRDAEGAVQGFFALVQDITANKRAQQALEQAQHRLSLALRAGRSGTFEWDIVANRTAWSEESLELHGFGKGEFRGSREAWITCIHPEDVERVLDAFERALGDGELAVDYRIRRHDTGEIRWLHCRGAVNHDEQRRPLRMVGINVDITEQKRAEEALREVDRRKDEFLAMLAHELRNPLAPIRYVAHILAHDNTDRQSVRRNVPILLRQVSHLVRLVDDLLDAARIRRGMIEVKKEYLHAESALQRALETMQATFGEKHQTLRFTPAAGPLPVRGDAVRLEQVFVNLLANASKYSPEGGVIHVSAQLNEPEAVIRVRDEGAGIDPQMLPHVFDLFLQADQSLDRPQGGLGIGLTIVKRVVELHGGRVEARSDGLGQGSEFNVILPLVEPEQNLAERERGYRPVRRRVLVVEDNADSAQMLCALLEGDGHTVAAARDGGEALTQLEAFSPEFVLMDIGLPGMDGYALAGLMRQRTSGKSVRMYALTGYGYPEDRAMALRSGFDGHLTKPVDPERLLRLLSDALPERSHASSQRAPH